MTRQEIKQLDTEIPWREIMTMSAAVKDKYVASVVKEYEGWVKWSGIRPLTDAEAEKVFQDPRLRKRMLKSRAAYKDKSRGLADSTPSWPNAALC